MIKYKLLPLLGFVGLFLHGAKIADKSVGFAVDSAYHTSTHIVKSPVEGVKLGYKHELKHKVKK